MGSVVPQSVPFKARKHRFFPDVLEKNLALTGTLC